MQWMPETEIVWWQEGCSQMLSKHRDGGLPRTRLRTHTVNKYCKDGRTKLEDCPIVLEFFAQKY
jgi:hypothetical protein